MDDQLSQGSDQSPSIEAQEVYTDPFEAHLSGGGEQGTQPEGQQEIQTEQPPQPEPPAEPQGRAEQRIQELIRQNNELNQRAQMADQLQMFIASNPQARAAYEQAIGQGATPAQAQQFAAQQQQSELPEWDPFDEDVVAAHREAMKAEAKQEILQELQPLMQFMQQQQAQAVQAEVQNALTEVQQAIFSEVPSAKENPAHFALTKAKLLEQLQTLPPDYQQAVYDYEYLSPQDRLVVNQVLNHCVKEASKQTKELIGLLGNPQPQRPAQDVPKPFAEGGTNLVAPRSNVPSDPFLAHITRNNHS